MSDEFMFNEVYAPDSRPVLRDVLQPDAVYAEHLTPLMDVKVVRRYDLCDPANSAAVPNKFRRYRNMFSMYELENGKFVGFNENPATGWSWVVAGRAK